MNHLRKRRHFVEHDNVDRWLVSYADYMTLLFALFVVLYAMAMVDEEPFETATESIGKVFQAKVFLPKNRGHGDDILDVNTSKTNKRLYGNGILDVAGPELVNGEITLSNVSDSEVGTNLTSLEKELHTALYDLIESGFAQLQIDGDWLEIELNSNMLFPSGSSSATNNATTVLAVIYDVIGSSSNFIRVRGYTDNQPINTEIFSSNWELSVSRATAILRVLEDLTLDPARMAIEGYGQYYPREDNKTAKGRSQNRRVVIAISKYGLEKSNLLATPTISVQDVEAIKQIDSANDEENEIRIIRLDNGGIRITTRENDKSSSQQNNN
ncbi:MULTISPECIES: flagellar motor protein MotB [unclassified Colwellia]|uniref:flagellar motor protein MotB n=1 Tax=unclassified Colwellia TaxID=196834 RepID=UPI0015F6A65D|nr:MULTISPECIES: flagellar motor protein MotB [unclassified Colwellia]MBA6233440.1 OmpA family protein [Colwellia sp. MB02u-7]MBA6236530.1 OmpA family protein [Colwellia sp. MB02u-11]MBA6257064.1 OmpA family protein [Colwellia sp. MB3u-28]MBA6260931.1 OmpA family protein [Colwellia sp. MB3u-41]MBA6298071.1 OmpA family protein [Colwellia sp. MB3u-22]